MATDLKPIVVIGATARSAGEIMSQALAQGRRVTGFARNPDRIKIDHPNFIRAKGDVYDLGSVTAALRGDEVVVSLLGRAQTPGKFPDYVDIYSVGGMTTITAMRRKGNKRIITMTSGGTAQIPPAQPTTDDFSDNFVWKDRNTYQDMQRWEKILHASDLEYVVVRPRRLAEGPVRNNLQFSYHPNHTAFSERVCGNQSTVTYADVAKFTLTLAEGNQYLGTAVGICSDLFLGNGQMKSG